MGERPNRAELKAMVGDLKADLGRLTTAVQDAISLLAEDYVDQAEQALRRAIDAEGSGSGTAQQPPDDDFVDWLADQYRRTEEGAP